MVEYRCNLTIGDISPQSFKDFQLVLDEATNEFQVKSFKDGFAWGKGASPKGAVISALKQGIRMNKIDLGNTYVPIHECLDAVRD